MNRSNLKIIYLFLLAGGLFFIQAPWMILSMLAAQFLIVVVSGIQLRSLQRIAKRLFWFSLLILFSYLFIALDETSIVYRHTLLGLDLQFNLSALQEAMLMLCRVYTLVLASIWVQRTVAPTEFVAGLTRLGFPVQVAVSISVTLALVDSPSGSGDGHGTGGGKGGGRHRKRSGEQTKQRVFTWQALRSGAIDGILNFIERTLQQTSRYLHQHYPELSREQVLDISLIAFFGLAILGLKVFQLFPGLPIAPGHKNILILPLFLLVATLTHSPRGGLYAGLTGGFVSFMLGYGKFGILEVTQFAVPGLIADLIAPLLARAAGVYRWSLMLLAGLLMGFGRFVANLLMVMLAGSPEVAYLLLLPMLVSQVTFGGASVVISVIILAPEFLDRMKKLLTNGQSKNE